MIQARFADSGAALTALLRYVGNVRDRAVAEILAHAEDECRTVLGAARRKAREQVSRSFHEERRDAELRVRLAGATSAARLRRARQALTAAALEKVWALIERALHERWRVPAARRAWVAMALREASRHLPAGTWQIAHPPTWNPDEVADEIARAAAFREGVAFEFRPARDLDAGLRITCGPAELDASVAGLLRTRARVEGQWLAELERSRRTPAPARTGT